jgi:hypothetical protein
VLKAFPTTQKNKTGQENNSREKMREISLEPHSTLGKKECRVNWFGKEKRKLAT